MWKHQLGRGKLCAGPSGAGRCCVSGRNLCDGPKDASPLHFYTELPQVSARLRVQLGAAGVVFCSPSGDEPIPAMSGLPPMVNV